MTSINSKNILNLIKDNKIGGANQNEHKTLHLLSNLTEHIDQDGSNTVDAGELENFKILLSDKLDNTAKPAKSQGNTDYALLESTLENVEKLEGKWDQLLVYYGTDGSESNMVDMNNKGIISGVSSEQMESYAHNRNTASHKTIKANAELYRQFVEEGDVKALDKYVEQANIRKPGDIEFSSADDKEYKDLNTFVQRLVALDEDTFGTDEFPDELVDILADTSLSPQEKLDRLKENEFFNTDDKKEALEKAFNDKGYLESEASEEPTDLIAHLNEHLEAADIDTLSEELIEELGDVDSPEALEEALKEARSERFNNIKSNGPVQDAFKELAREASADSTDDVELAQKAADDVQAKLGDDVELTPRQIEILDDESLSTSEKINKLAGLLTINSEEHEALDKVVDELANVNFEEEHATGDVGDAPEGHEHDDEVDVTDVPSEIAAILDDEDKSNNVKARELELEKAKLEDEAAANAADNDKAAKQFEDRIAEYDKAISELALRQAETEATEALVESVNEALDGEEVPEQVADIINSNENPEVKANLLEAERARLNPEEDTDAINQLTTIINIVRGHEATSEANAGEATATANATAAANAGEATATADATAAANAGEATATADATAAANAGEATATADATAAANAGEATATADAAATANAGGADSHAEYEQELLQMQQYIAMLEQTIMDQASSATATAQASANATAEAGSVPVHTPQVHSHAHTHAPADAATAMANASASAQAQALVTPSVQHQSVVTPQVTQGVPTQVFPQTTAQGAIGSSAVSNEQVTQIVANFLYYLAQNGMLVMPAA